MNKYKILSFSLLLASNLFAADQPYSEGIELRPVVEFIQDSSAVDCVLSEPALVGEAYQGTVDGAGTVVGATAGNLLGHCLVNSGINALYNRLPSRALLAQYADQAQGFAWKVANHVGYDATQFGLSCKQLVLNNPQYAALAAGALFGIAAVYSDRQLRKGTFTQKLKTYTAGAVLSALCWYSTAAFVAHASK